MNSKQPILVTPLNFEFYFNSCIQIHVEHTIWWYTSRDNLLKALQTLHMLWLPLTKKDVKVRLFSQAGSILKLSANIPEQVRNLCYGSLV
jgi:hypothetical protein